MRKFVISMLIALSPVGFTFADDVVEWMLINHVFVSAGTDGCSVVSVGHK